MVPKSTAPMKCHTGITMCNLYYECIIKMLFDKVDNLIVITQLKITKYTRLDLNSRLSVATSYSDTQTSIS